MLNAYPNWSIAIFRHRWILWTLPFSIGASSGFRVNCHFREAKQRGPLYHVPVIRSDLLPSSFTGARTSSEFEACRSPSLSLMARNYTTDSLRKWIEGCTRCKLAYIGALLGARFDGPPPDRE